MDHLTKPVEEKAPGVLSLVAACAGMGKCTEELYSVRVATGPAPVQTSCGTAGIGDICAWAWTSS